MGAPWPHASTRGAPPRSGLSVWALRSTVWVPGVRHGCYEVGCMQRVDSVRQLGLGSVWTVSTVLPGRRTPQSSDMQSSPPPNSGPSNAIGSRQAHLEARKKVR